MEGKDDMTSISLLRAGATTLACVLLGLQIVGGWEYTEGGTLYTRASMIAAMVTLAALPVFIEAARREGKPAISVALFVAFVAFLAYSLPAWRGQGGQAGAGRRRQSRQGRP
jgi:cation transport ATPase